MSKSDFQKVTGEKSFPDYLRPNLNGDELQYYCNTQVSYTLRDIHIKLDVLWKFETPAGGGDTHFATFKGTKSRIEIRQGKEQKYRPELYVVPNNPGEKNSILAALKQKVESLNQAYPGIGVSDLGKELVITIPDTYRVGHEAHFAQVTNRFLEYLKHPKTLPAWEKPNMVAKYYVTTTGLELSRKGETAKK